LGLQTWNDPCPVDGGGSNGSPGSFGNRPFDSQNNCQGRKRNAKKLIMAVAMCGVIASANAALGQSGRVGWDGTWVGGWDRGAGVQPIFAGDTLIGFYLRNDYKDVLRSVASSEGGKTFTWDKGEATLTHTANGGAQLIVRERGQPEVSIPLKRDGQIASRPTLGR
jgi:hypothetical protein